MLLRGFCVSFKNLNFEQKHLVAQCWASTILAVFSVGVALWVFAYTFPLQQKEHEVQQQALELQKQAQEIAVLKWLIEKNDATSRAMQQAAAAYELNNIVVPRPTCGRKPR